MYLLLVPPIAVVIALIVIAASRLAEARPGRVDEAEAHRRCLEALDPRAPVRKAARQAAQDSPQASARIHRPA
jgi:hypothetical protein